MEGDDRERIAALTAAANELVGQIQQLNQDAGHELVTLAKRSTTNRKMIYGLAVSLALDLILTVVLVLVGVRANEAGAQAEQVHAQQVVTCESTNDGRRLNVELWDYILSLPPVEPRTKAQDKQIAGFREYVHRVFAPRDCSKI